MISILRTNLKLISVLFLLVFLTPSFALAQNSLSLSVSPTLFEMTANPEQNWKSTIRVINSNPYEITVYADVVNFSSQGEGGQSTFLPVVPEEAGGQTLAEWINLGVEELTIPAERTLEIPFTINVPENAPPGGHYAAVLIGTKPPEGRSGTSQLETAQIVTSLIFLRVTGDVVEDGAIREFRSIKTLVEKPEMTFELRFQNKGNVHILPQGEIEIFNMWGEERGVIPVNRKMMFGNVLPDQIRKYTFSWSGEWSMADMGRYTAVATLGYGQDSRQFATSETFFWVLPWKIAGTILLILFAFVFVITWAIRVYIQKVLSMAGVSADGQVVRGFPDRPVKKKVSVVAPIEEGILDLRQRFQASSTLTEKISNFLSFINNYKLFFLIALLIILFVIALSWYFKNASVENRGYEVTVGEEEDAVTISSEQVQYDKLKSSHVLSDDVPEQKDLPAIKLVNRSGINGLAAKMRLLLESRGYEISELTTDFGTAELNTVIVYSPDYSEEALMLSAEIDDALLSSFAEAPEDEPIIIYVGSDFENTVE